MPSFRVDADGDVEMTIPPPVYELISAPELASWDQESLVKWLRERRRYREAIEERCRISQEPVASVLRSVRASVKPKLLDYLARYVFQQNRDTIGDQEIMDKIEERVAEVMNGHIPDIFDFFKTHLRMDLKEQDVEARVVKYFVDFDQLIEEHGFASMLAAGGTDRPDYRDRMKNRCKLIVENLSPAMLKTEIKRLVSLQHREAKTDDIALHQLILTRAKMQQRYHLMEREEKADRKQPVKPDGGRAAPKPDNRKAEPKRDTSKSPRPGANNATKTHQPPPKDGCLFCKGPHLVRFCPTATEEQKQQCYQRLRESKVAKVKAARVRRIPGHHQVVVNDLVELPYRADTGSEVNVLPASAVRDLAACGSPVVTTAMEMPVFLERVGGDLLACNTCCDVDVMLGTAAGPVHLRRVHCVILDDDEEEFLLGNPALISLGIDVDRQMEQLASGGGLDGDDGDDIRGDPEVGHDSDAEMNEFVNSLVIMAGANGFPEEMMPALRRIVLNYKDVWRSRLGADEPARVKPYRVTLEEGAQPIRCKPRRYSPLASSYTSNYMRELVASGYVYPNNGSRWSSAVVPVQKAGGEEFRVTSDYRRLNRITVPIAASVPNLSVVSSRVKGAKVIGKFDMFKGFWQLPLHEDSREYFSIQTDEGVFTPTRVPQGGVDSALHFQSTMQEAFADQINDHLLVYVDDVILFASTFEEYLEVLEKFFARLRELNLKLNVKKSCLYQQEVTWCGKIIDGDGVTHDPARVESLVSLPLPLNAAELQRFLCAANWLRDSVVDYGRAVAPLQAKFDAAMQGLSRRKCQAAGVELSWSEDEIEEYKAFLKRLASSATLSFPDDDAVVCLSSDASASGWAVILTQVKDWKDGVPIHEQSHELLVCKGGSFKGSQLHWSVVEKEAYPVVYAATELEYLLHRPLGYRIYTDHANLIQIFCPSSDLKKHVRGKLQRWSLKLAGTRYEIEHVRGEDNHWADLVSRWPVREDVEVVVRAKAVRTRSQASTSQLRPLQDDDFEWPSPEAVREAQQRYYRALPASSEERGGLQYVDGKVWIPRQAKDLLTRVLVVAHCGIQAHRGVQVMLNQLQGSYAINNVREVVTRFVNGCLLCKHIKGGKLVQRPWSETATATKRNEVLHMDYISMGGSYGSTKYVLVLKDELTHFCELIACDSPTSDVAVTAILDWHKRYGLPAKWVSDNGSHFKSLVMAELATRLRGVQSFVPVYSPWINGTVERINRDLLQVVRALLLELELDTHSWEFLLPIVQANLNQSAVASLGNKAPMELFTGLPVTTPLDTCLLPNNDSPLSHVDLSNVEAFLQQLRASLHSMHMDAVDRKERRRLYQQAQKKGDICNFSAGDFVLWSRVDARLESGKLLVRWVGPFQVEEVKSHSFLIRHLLTRAVHEVHGSRLKFYHDPSLELSEELVEHIAKQGIVLGVEAILQHRYNETSRQHELLISWVGLESIEDSWKPLDVMLADIPTKVKEYAASQDDAELRGLCGLQAVSQQ